MNTAQLKKYGPQARRDFLSGVSDRAAKIGLRQNGLHEAIEVRGDFAIMDGRSYPKVFASQRKKLEDKIKKAGFDAVLEEAAYTWFNRFMALRYMEVQGFLDHGFRVFSHPEGKPMPEILEQAPNVTLPGLKREEIVELKLDGSKDEQLYRLLLLGQCRSLNQAMPFLFESIDDSTELLLPDNLLASDSIVRSLASETEEESWRQIEIIGWLYQFYISEKKIEVDALVKKGKSVLPEDIPAKTQIFTPNWVVKYLVQNSLGKLWLEISPSSTLKRNMPYFVEKPAQLPGVQARLDQLASDQRDKHKTPETITFIDPCVGSGHILVEAYDLFKAIYEERGYAKRDIPKLILEKNLFGLEIDDRAAQIAGFALMMKARADDRSIFSNAPKLNVYSVQSSEGLDAALVGSALAGGQSKKAATEPEPVFAPTSLLPELDRHPTLVASTSPSKPSHRLQEQIEMLLDSFLEAKTFGSLIRVPEALDYKQIAEALHANQDSARGFGVSHDLQAILTQTALLAKGFDVMVTNPPYLGGKAMTKELKDFAKDNFPNTKSDLFAMFMERGFEFVVASGYSALVTMQSWMFLSSYDEFRQEVVENTILGDMVHMGNGVMGIAFGTAATIFKRARLPQHSATYSYCEMGDIGKDNRPLAFPVKGKRHCSISQSEFKKIPGWPIAYFATDRVRQIFEDGIRLDSVAKPKVGLQTGDNSKLVRSWWEVPFDRIGFEMPSLKAAHLSSKRWFPYNKGGEYRRWFGNHEDVVDWECDGKRVRENVDDKGKVRSRPQNVETYFRPSASWTFVTSGRFAIRHFPKGFIYDVAGSSVFSDTPGTLEFITCVLNSSLVGPLMADYNPTLNFQVGNISSVPLPKTWKDQVELACIQHSKLVGIYEQDWNEYETAWGFSGPAPQLTASASAQTWWNQRRTACLTLVEKANDLESENNSVMASVYDLSGQVETKVASSAISLWANPEHVFRPKKKNKSDTEAEDEIESGESADESAVPSQSLDSVNREVRFREKGLKELISYFVGCLMGRYSLDRPGLIYAGSAGVDFERSTYLTISPDEDAIIPVMEDDWFPEQDASNRFSDFVSLVWPKDQEGGVSVDENIRFVAESMGFDATAQPLQSIRTYFATQFYKDHLRTYKNRPIYWLFSSGKERAFQSLVYLHRYNGGTLSRMRMEYVVPLQQRMSAQLEQLDGDIEASSTTADRKRREKDREKLKKQIAELRIFDEKLRHYADQRIELDLDDGVKVNYAKFGDLVAETKAITGEKTE